MRHLKIRDWAYHVVALIKLSAEALRLADGAHLCIANANLDPEASEEVRKERTRAMNILRSLGARFIGIGEVLQDTDKATIEIKAAGLIKECEIALKTLQVDRLREELEDERRERRKDENAGQ